LGATAGILYRMKVGDYEFVRVGEIEPMRDADGLIRQYMPQDRYVNPRGLPLNNYGAGPFCKFTIPGRFRMSGVYLLTIDGEIRYVGECANLSSRFNAGYGNISPRNCFKGGQETNCRLNNLVFLAATAGERISLWFFQTAEYKAMEAALRAALRLSWNRI
jgi:hypothetical protein